VEEGFEPSVGEITYGGLANRCLKPLGHPTAEARKSIKRSAPPESSSITGKSTSAHSDILTAPRSSTLDRA
jgi:hypothetical protein